MGDGLPNTIRFQLLWVEATSNLCAFITTIVAFNSVAINLLIGLKKCSFFILFFLILLIIWILFFMEGSQELKPCCRICMHVSIVRARGQSTLNMDRDMVSTRIFTPKQRPKRNKLESIFTKLHFDIHAKTTERAVLFFVRVAVVNINGCGVGGGFGFVLVGGNLKILDCGETAVSGSLDLYLSNSFANATIGP